MIYDTLEHLESYRGIHPGVMRGLELLRDTDFSRRETGRHEIDGDRLFVLVQEYDSKPENDTPEAHRKYIDIQYLLSGRETPTRPASPWTGSPRPAGSVS